MERSFFILSFCFVTQVVRPKIKTRLVGYQPLRAYPQPRIFRRFETISNTRKSIIYLHQRASVRSVTVGPNYRFGGAGVYPPILRPLKQALLLLHLNVGH